MHMRLTPPIHRVRRTVGRQLAAISFTSKQGEDYSKHGEEKITASKITASKITASKITASKEKITASTERRRSQQSKEKITASMQGEDYSKHGEEKITASKITASKITASKITASKITASKITASKITASKITASKEKITARATTHRCQLHQIWLGHSWLEGSCPLSCLMETSTKHLPWWLPNWTKKLLQMRVIIAQFCTPKQLHDQIAGATGLD